MAGKFNFFKFGKKKKQYIEVSKILNSTFWKLKMQYHTCVKITSHRLHKSSIQILR